MHGNLDITELGHGYVSGSYRRLCLMPLNSYSVNKANLWHALDKLAWPVNEILVGSACIVNGMSLFKKLKGSHVYPMLYSAKYYWIKAKIKTVMRFWCLLQQDYQKSRTERNCMKRFYSMQLDHSKQEDLTEESVLARKFQQITVDKSPNAIDRKLRSSG